MVEVLGECQVGGESAAFGRALEPMAACTQVTASNACAVGFFVEFPRPCRAVVIFVEGVCCCCICWCWSELNSFVRTGWTLHVVMLLRLGF